MMPIDRIYDRLVDSPAPSRGPGSVGDPRAFDAALEAEARRLESESQSEPGAAPPSWDVHFSRHAEGRLRSRQIELGPAELGELSQAIDRLSERKARESLLLMGDHAFVVGVEKRTVITAMTRKEAIGSIFTNIDSTLVLR
jgi:flagellar operon protein